MGFLKSHPRCAMTVLFWPMLAAGMAEAGEPNASAEYSLKAAFIYNFLQFSEWPDEAFSSRSSPLVIGVYGKNSLASSLEQIIQGERIKGRKIIISTVFHADESKNCHVLFIPRSGKDAIEEILLLVRDKNILTISEVQRFAERGGSINFYEEGNKLRFEINIKAVKHAGVSLHSNVLRLARIVDGSEYEN